MAHRYPELNRASVKRHAARNTQIIREAKNVPCTDCGEEFPYYVMDFDHRESSLKRQSVGTMTTYSKGNLLAEIAKCDVVCANCHRIRTFERLEDQGSQ